MSADAPGSALAAARPAWADYVELVKPRITLMVVMTTFVGFAVAHRGPMPLGLVAATLVGTALVAAGSATMNMLLERRTDALMHRTRNRPLPAGRLRGVEALAWGLLLSVAGLALLFLRAGPLPAAVALATWTSYLFLYTPLKTRTSLATVVGALPGALPPVIGWTAAASRFEPGAFVLFAIMFLWQIPHFLAIAWIYREDYARGGLPMLPVLDPEGRMTGRQAVANSLALTLISLTPAVAGLAGSFYVVGAAVLGLAFTGVAVYAAVLRTTPAARKLFLASLLYLPALFTLLLLGRK